MKTKSSKRLASINWKIAVISATLFCLGYYIAQKQKPPIPSEQDVKTRESRVAFKTISGNDLSGITLDSWEIIKNLDCQSLTEKRFIAITLHNQSQYIIKGIQFKVANTQTGASRIFSAVPSINTYGGYTPKICEPMTTCIAIAEIYNYDTKGMGGQITSAQVAYLTDA